MDFLVPPMYDVSNIDMWKFKMSAYIKAQGLHVYLVTIKKSYLGDDKYLEANTQAIEALRHTLSKEYLFFDFSLWFCFYSVEQFDFSQGTNDICFGEGI